MSLIQCLIQREGNTEVVVGGIKLVFKPNDKGDSVCDVISSGAREFLLKTKLYRDYVEEDAPESAPVTAPGPEPSPQGETKAAEAPAPATDEAGDVRASDGPAIPESGLGDKSDDIDEDSRDPVDVDIITAVKALKKTGLDNAEIGRQLGVSRQKVTAILGRA
jgi:hypothetical protein